MESKTKFAAVMEVFPDALWVIDYQKDRHFWFTCERNMIKYGISGGEAEKDFWSKNLHPEDFDYATRGYNHALQNPEIDCYEQEYRFRAANGKYVLIHDSIRFLRRNDGRVLQSVGRWREVSNETIKGCLVQSLFNGKEPPAPNSIKLAVPTADGLVFVYVKNIAYCKASSNYTEISMADGSLHIVSRTLKEYERILSEHGFFRIHHSFLINLMYLEKYVRGDGGYVVMQDGKTFDVSKRKRDAFLTKIRSDFVSLPSVAGSSTAETITNPRLSLANS
jgi:hypothetical protein